MNKIKYVHARSLGLFAFSLLGLSLSSEATATTYNVGTGTGQVIVNSGTIPNLLCGDTIAVKGGTYIGVSFIDIQGCAGNPITITNANGPVVIDGNMSSGPWGMTFEHVGNVVVKSDQPGTYGFKMQNLFRSAVGISKGSHDIDISGIWSTNTSYGFQVKTDPSCSVLNYVDGQSLISNIRIHDNYIEATAYEGMYLGYYDANPVSLTCNGVAYSVKAERLSKVEVDHNILKNVANDAIKLRLCRDGCDIHDNQISGWGVLRTSDAAWCFGITVGSETYGKIYNNTLDHGYCTGIDIRTNEIDHQFQVYNNTISYAGTLPNGNPGASWAGGVLFNIATAGQKFKIWNNHSSNNLGADFEITNYSNYSYEGYQCGNGSNIKVTNGTPAPQICSLDPILESTTLVNFGSSSSTGPGLNHFIDSFSVGSALPSLVNTSNQATGMALEITESFGGVNRNGTSAPASSIGIPTNGAISSFYGNTRLFPEPNGVTAPQASFLLSGLDPNKIYDFVFFASRIGAGGDNRETKYTVVGANSGSALLNASENTSNVAVVSGIRPNSHSITITLNKGPNNNNTYGFFYINFLKILTYREADGVTPSPTPTPVPTPVPTATPIPPTPTPIPPTPTPTPTPIPNAAPTANAGIDQSITLPASFTLNGSGSDPEGDVLIYNWSKVSGGNASFNNANAASTVVNGLVAGTYVFRLTVLDSGGLQGTDEMTLVVNPAPTPTPVPTATPIPTATPDPRAGTTHVWIRGKTTSDWMTANDYDALVFLPADYGQNPNKKYPVIFSFHGLNGYTLNLAHTGPHLDANGNIDAQGFIKQVRNGVALQNTFPAIVIAPNVNKANQNNSNVWWQHTYTRRLILDGLQKYAIDPRRVVATGLSAGGAAVEELMAYSRPLLAGIMPIAYMPPNKTVPSVPICDYQDFPIWANGNNPDGTFNAWEWALAGASSFKNQLEACPGYTGQFKININPTGGHTGWDDVWAKPEVRTWLISQSQP